MATASGMLNCVHCGVEFFAKGIFYQGPRKQKYCSRNCVNAHAGTKNRVERKCAVCESVFFVTKHHLSVRPCATCSPQCLHSLRRARLDNDRIVSLYRDGKTCREIGEMFDVSETAIQYRLRSAGEPRRNSGDYENPMQGRTHTAEAREKIRQANKRQFGQPGARERHAVLTAQQIASGRTGKTGNRLEAAFADILIDKNITFESSYRLHRYVFDFYLPQSNVLVECDGTFWHADPRSYPNWHLLSSTQRHNLQNDFKKNVFAASKGFRLLRFWEQDIHASPDEVGSFLIRHLDAMS